jgi:hypothetical protein
MSRFRLLPPEQEQALLAHCRDARYVWNLAVEQQQHWQPGLKAPGYLEQAAQLTEARDEYAWLRAGSQTVQQALRDFAQAMRNFFNGTHRRPTWRKAGVHEGFSAGRGETASRRAVESPLRSSMDAQGRVGAIPPVAAGASRCQVLSVG